jgi:hypothetical protein
MPKHKWSQWRRLKLNYFIKLSLDFSKMINYPCTNWRSCHRKKLKLLRVVGWQRPHRPKCAWTWQQWINGIKIWHNPKTGQFQRRRMQWWGMAGYSPSHSSELYWKKILKQKLVKQKPEIEINGGDLSLPSYSFDVIISFGFIDLVHLGVLYVSKCLKVFEVNY